MNRMISPLSNRQGSVMAIALLIMVTLTLVGLAAINDTIIESAVARNHTLYRVTLYLAEAGVRQATQIMEDYSDNLDVVEDLVAPSGSWVKPTIFKFATVNVGDFRSGSYGDFQACDLASGNNDASGFLVRYEGIAAGSSLDMTDPTSLYQFSVYGRGVGPMANDAAEGIVKVGYRMRF